jgi:hypothetical protein
VLCAIELECHPKKKHLYDDHKPQKKNHERKDIKQKG